MKTILLSLMLSMPLLAQGPGIAPGPGRIVRPPQPPSPQQPSGESSSDRLTENVKIRLTGQVFPDIKVDHSVTGIGPSFVLQRPGQNGSVLSTEYRISQGESGFVVNYSIGLRIRVATSAQNYEYQDVSLTGTVICKPGQPVTISQDGEAPLILTVAAAEAEK